MDAHPRKGVRGRKLARNAELQQKVLQAAAASATALCFGHAQQTCNHCRIKDTCHCDRQEAELEAALFGTADAIDGFGLEAAAPAPVWLDDDDDAAPDEAPSAAAAGGAVALWEDRRGDARAAG